MEVRTGDIGLRGQKAKYKLQNKDNKYSGNRFNWKKLGLYVLALILTATGLYMYNRNNRNETGVMANSTPEITQSIEPTIEITPTPVVTSTPTATPTATPVATEMPELSDEELIEEYGITDPNESFYLNSIFISFYEEKIGDKIITHAIPTFNSSMTETKPQSEIRYLGNGDILFYKYGSFPSTIKYLDYDSLITDNPNLQNVELVKMISIADLEEECEKYGRVLPDCEYKEFISLDVAGKSTDERQKTYEVYSKKMATRVEAIRIIRWALGPLGILDNYDDINPELANSTGIEKPEIETDIQQSNKQNDLNVVKGYATYDYYGKNTAKVLRINKYGGRSI